jgi:hypothetical protein
VRLRDPHDARENASLNHRVFTIDAALNLNLRELCSADVSKSRLCAFNGSAADVAVS